MKCKTVTSQGKPYGWVIYCPGCDEYHVIDTRWTFTGTLDKPTFRPSLLVWQGNTNKERRCHSFITDGRIQFLGDCYHALRGQTVDLPDLPREYD
jgi:Family of unknown function (DUF6527)